MLRYVALFHKDANSDWGVSFPDFPGCASAGATYEEALDLAAEALAFHVEGMRQDGDKIPQARTIEAIRASHESALELESATVALIPLFQPPAKAERFNISMDVVLAKMADDAAMRRFGGNRSAYLSELVRRDLIGLALSTTAKNSSGGPKSRKAKLKKVTDEVAKKIIRKSSPISGKKKSA